MVIITVASGLFGVVSTRALDPYQRGLLATATVWTAMITSIAGIGLPQAVTFHVGRHPARAGGVVATAFAIGLSLGTVVGALGVGVAMLAGGRAALPLAILFAATPAMMLAGFGLAALLGWGSLRAWGVLRVVGPTSALLAVAVVVLAGGHTAGAVACVTAGSSALSAAVVFVALRRRGMWSRPQRDCARDLASYGWRQVITGIAWLLTYKLDQLYLSVAVSPRALGLYAVAATIGEVIAPVAASSSSVMLARAAARGHSEVQVSLRWAVGFSLVIAVPACLICALFAEQILRLVFGAGFAPAHATLRIYIGGTVALAVATVLADTLRGLGRPLDAAKAELAGAASTITLLVLLVPSHGIVGAAAASTTSYTVVMVLLALILRGRIRSARSAASPEPAGAAATDLPAQERPNIA